MDSRPQIKIFPVSYTQLDYSFMVLSENVRYRIALAKSEEDADYILTNYRNVPYVRISAIVTACFRFSVTGKALVFEGSVIVV
jgi:hypothetical protein